MIIGNEKGSHMGEEREKHRVESIRSKEVSMKQYEQERFLMKRDARNWRFFSEDITNRRKKSTGNEIKEEIEGAVRSGRLTRKQADAEYEHIQKTQKQKEEIARELHREIEQGMKDLRIAVREGEIREGDACRQGDELRRNLEREIHAAHRRIDFEAQEQRIHQSIEEGRISEEDGERRLVEMHRRMESEERRMDDRDRAVRRHHEEREHLEERRYWEDEEELWERVAQGLKAAVRLGRMSEGEAREIWEEWRNHDEDEVHEHDHDENEEE
jgi:hypothetical protein